MAKTTELNPIPKASDGDGVAKERGRAYAGPMYSDDTGYMDSSKNMGPVGGPVHGGETPDPIGFESDLNRKAPKGQR